MNSWSKKYFVKLEVREVESDKKLVFMLSANFDSFQREALDKLALRVYNMQDKICDAAMLSVLYRPPPDEGLPKASFLQNLDSKGMHICVCLCV